MGLIWGNIDIDSMNVLSVNCLSFCCRWITSIVHQVVDGFNGLRVHCTLVIKSVVHRYIIMGVSSRRCKIILQLAVMLAILLLHRPFQDNWMLSVVFGGCIHYQTLRILSPLHEASKQGMIDSLTFLCGHQWLIRPFNAVSSMNE